MQKYVAATATSVGPYMLMSRALGCFSRIWVQSSRGPPAITGRGPRVTNNPNAS